MDFVTQLQLYSLFFLFFLAAIFSLAETSLTGMSRIKIAANIKNNHPKAKYLKVWVSDPNKLLATLLICTNTVAISASTIGAFLSLRIAKFFNIGDSLVAVIVAAVITVILIIFGEISPKVFAIHNTEKLGLILIGPIVRIYTVIRPVTEIFLKISNFIITLVGGQASSSVPMITAKDLDTVLNVSAEAGYIDEQEKAMMASIMGFNDMQVKQVMVPRTSITAVDINWSEDRIIDVIMEAGYSRMPVFKDSLDNIVGIIYTKDMLSMIKNRGLIIFHDLIRVPYFIPETKNAGDLLKEFKKGKLHVAIVVDEFGGTAGLVSLEDILEEIVGEIHDEYDVDEKEIEDIGNGAYIVKGMIEISKVNNEPLKLEIPEDENINTMSGFLTALFGYVPKPGETVKFGNFNFTVVRSDERKIMRIKIEPVPKNIVK